MSYFVYYFSYYLMSSVTMNSHWQLNNAINASLNS